jgi:small-conductance mechanosensitive channel
MIHHLRRESMRPVDLGGFPPACGERAKQAAAVALRFAPLSPRGRGNRVRLLSLSTGFSTGRESDPLLPCPLRGSAPRRSPLGWFGGGALPALLLLALPDPARAAGPPPGPSGKPAETKKVELHKLSNEDLLKAAAATYDPAAQDHLAQLRAVAAAERMLKEVRQAASPLKPAKDPEPAKKPDRPEGGEAKPPEPKRSEEEAARAALERARGREKVAKRSLQLTDAEAEWLRQLAARLEAARSAGLALQNALDDLKGQVVEIELRVKDGTLAEEKVPPPLRPEAVEKQKREVLAELAALKGKQEEVPKALARVAALRETALKGVLAAAAELGQASAAYAREQKRKEMEKAHAAKKPADLLADLEQLLRDGIGLKGSYELVLGRCKARAGEAARLRRELDALQAPKVKVPQLARAEDLERAARATRELIRFFTARASKIEELSAALRALVKQGQELEADAAVSSEHLFKMVVLVGLLQKAAFPEEKLPAEVRPKRLAAALARQAKSASDVLAGVEKAKGDQAVLAKQLAETKTARDAAAKQLEHLEQSRAATLAALKWEGRLKEMATAQVTEAFARTRLRLNAKLEQLKGQEQAYGKALAAVARARASLDAARGPFLRAAAADGQAEKQKLLAELRKEAGLERSAKGQTPPAEPPKPDMGKKPEPEKKAEPDRRTELEKVAGELSGFQQGLAGRLEGRDERQAKKQELLAALKGLEDAAGLLAKTLGEARLLALEWHATAGEIKTRVGKGELAPDKSPEDLTNSLRGELRGRLDATATAVLQVLGQTQQERGKASRPDPSEEALSGLAREVLELVGKRTDLLAGVKRLAAESKRDRKDLPPSEQKRLERVVAERLDDESSGWDVLLGVASSKSDRALSELLESYYRELVEIEEKEANLKKQRENLGQMVKLSRKEEAVLAKLLPLLAAQIARLEAVREEEALLARARLRPERAEELLKAYQAKTGRLLARPVPLGDKDRAAKVEELAALVFDRHVQVEAAKRWQAVLAARPGPQGAKREAGAYRDELTLLDNRSAANRRRIATLAGAPPAEAGKADETGSAPPTPVTGGEIGKTWEELRRVRSEGMKVLALKVGIVLLVALLLPRVVMAVVRTFRRRRPAGTPDLLLSAVRTFLRIATWVAALVIILSMLGVDVTAILAGLGIGGLAVGLAAQAMIADVLAALVIFLERRFKIGDVIRLDKGEPARVIGLSWRSTQVRTADGLVVTIPNQKVTGASFENLTRDGRTYDTLAVQITTPRDVNQVLAAIKEALAECQEIAPGQGQAIREFSQTPEAKVVKYTFSWFLPDYETRNRVRDEVFARISSRLAREDMKETEIALA